MKKTALAILVLLMAFVGSAFASPLAELSGTLTADDAFSLFISTGNHQRGTLIGTGTDWTTPLTFANIALSSPGTYFIHIKAKDLYGTVAGILGNFTLTGNAVFSNGKQQLQTQAAHWGVSTTGWGDYEKPTISDGAGGTGRNDGTGPWGDVLGGSIPGIHKNTPWIWTNNGMDITEGDVHPTRYFTTKITVTPEPVSLLLFGLGAGVLGLTKLRRKKA